MLEVGSTLGPAFPRGRWKELVMQMALGFQGLSPSLCIKGLSSMSGLGYGWTIPPAPAQPGSPSYVMGDPEGPAHDTILFCSSEAVEDGCGHAGTAGHGDAGPAPGSWEVGWAEGKGPPGEEEVPSKRAGASGKLAGEPAASFPFLFLFSRWGTWDFSSCYYFSSLQLWAWSSLETWVS